MGRPPLLVLAAWLAAANLAAFQQQAVFRADVDLVKVDVQVAAGDQVIGGLTADDFLVFEEGIPQTVVYFAHEEEPVWLVLLVDVSGSVQQYLRQIAASAREALAQMGPADQMAIFIFTREAKLWEGFQNNWSHLAEALKYAIADRSLGAGTAINASIMTAAAYLGERATGPGRRSILIITDNRGLNYQEPDELVLRALSRAGAVLNAIVVGNATPPAPPAPGEYRNPDFTPSNVFKLAAESGGEVLRAGQTRELAGVLKRLRARYSLHYRPPPSPPGSFRRIQVELSPAARRRLPKATVRARAGYFRAE